MSEVKFQFHVDSKAAIQKGLREHGKVTRRFDLGALSQDDRDLLAANSRQANSGDDLVVSNPGNTCGLTADGDTVADVLAVLRKAVADKAEAEARQKAEDDAETERLEAEDRETLATGRLDTSTTYRSHPTASYGNIVYFKPLATSYANDRVKARLVTRHSPEWKAKNDELFAAAVAAYDAAQAEAEARKAAEQQAKIDQKRKAEAEMEAWVAAHGSDRLKKCVENGWECDAVYRDERLALEFPGWVWSDDKIPELDDPRNPPAEAVALFEKAVASLPESAKGTAELFFWKVTKESRYDCEPIVHTGYCVQADPGDWSYTCIVFGYDGPDASAE